MTRTLSAHAADLGITLAGSVIAVPVAGRLDLARSLTAAGHTVHADVIEGSYRGQAGVGPAELADLAAIPGVRLDVHLMVDDPSARLPGLPRGISRISLQCGGPDDLDNPDDLDDLDDPGRTGGLADLVAASRNHADQVWLAVHRGGAGTSAVATVSAVASAGADGVLVLLTPPGQPGHEPDLDRLSLVHAAIAHGLAAGVDGGVSGRTLDAVGAAGARYAVVGRALAVAGAAW